MNSSLGDKAGGIDSKIGKIPVERPNGDVENGITVRKRALRTTFSVQADALLRKNLTLQRRSWCMNTCLVCFPVVLCLLIVILQAFIDSMLKSSDGLKCGCLCLDEQRSPDCKRRNNSLCGLYYSDSSYFCEINHPYETPSILQVPVCHEEEYVNKLSVCKVPQVVNVPYTSAEENVDNANAIAEWIFEPMTSMADDFVALLSGKGQPGHITPLQVMSSVVMGSDTPPEIGLQFREPLTNYRERPMFLILKNCSELAPLLAMAPGELSVVGEDNRSSIPFALPIQPSYVGQPMSDDPIPEDRKLIPLLVRCLSANITLLRNRSEVHKRLYQSYKVEDEGVPLALDFRKTNRTHLDINIWYNETLSDFSFGRWPKRQLRLPRSLNAVTNAFLRWATNKSEVYAPMLYVKDMPKPETTLNLDISSAIGPLFFCWVLHLLLPVTVFNLVYEKEKNLRMMMKMHGLGDNAYWVISYGYFFVISILYNALFLAAASAIRLNFFTRNDYSVQVVFFFLVANNIIALSFLITPLFSSVKTAMVVSYLYVFGMGLLGRFVIGYIWQDVSLTPWVLRGIQIVPAWAIYRGLLELGAYASVAKYEGSQGLTWDRMSDPYNGMDEVMFTLLVEWFVFVLLALYLDKVILTGSGVKRHPLFFLKYFSRRSADRRADGKRVPLMSMPGNVQQDVLQERATVEMALNDPKGYSIVCDHLHKVYPGVDGNREKVAVQELSLAVRRGECFGMLGPNGAGKTTSINMMIGFLSPSSGNAFIEGLSIEDDVDMIYSLMGVCPQHDLLWESLSAREHLYFFGRLKNLKGQELTDAVDTSLKNVDLHHATVADRFAGKYSGGMKRRLSVAISLIGDPLVVYMDEPSTGLDPASRNNLWKVVKAAKKNRAIILTTHSMEEAEALCDRIGIVVDGEFQCIGAPKELTARYGGTFVFTISTPVSQEAEAQDLVISLSPNVRKIYGIAGTQKFEIPVGDVKIADVFATVEAAKKRLTIHAWGIANTTLEDVFIKIAKGAGSVM